MNEVNENLNKQSLANLAIDPDVLAKELAAELLGDPLDELEIGSLNSNDSNSKNECDAGLKWLQQGPEERLQGLRVFCEHRDLRALPLLLPLLDEPCPVVRMSAVYALGRNPCPRAVNILVNLLQFDSNAYVRKATAWSLGNYSESPVLFPLINSLRQDVAAVRLWASSSLAEAGSISKENADIAAVQLLISLKIDVEPIVRSNCIWSLGRLYEHLTEDRRHELVEAFVLLLLQDSESSVRYEARTALEQLDDLPVKARLQKLIEEGLVV